MKTKVFVFIILVFLCWACGDSEIVIDPPLDVEDPPLLGTVDTTKTIDSEILDGPQHYAIYLPPGYDTSHVDYPVLYLLHGKWQTYLDWPANGVAHTTDNLIYQKDLVPMIVVMPDGYNTFYCNNFEYNNLLYEDYFIEEFIPAIETSYRIKGSGENRAISGLSMGGYGATLHAFKRPGMFCCAYSMSGPIFVGNTAPDLKELIDTIPDDQLSQLPAYTMDCGTEDPTIESNRDFDAYLTEKKIAHALVEKPGSHDWSFWKASLPRALQAASEQFEN